MNESPPFCRLCNDCHACLSWRSSKRVTEYSAQPLFIIVMEVSCGFWCRGQCCRRIARCRANVFFEKLRCTYHTSTSMNQSLSMVKNPAVATMRKGFLSCACCMVPPARQQTMLTVSCVKHEARGASQSSMPSSYPITAWNVAMSAFKSGSVKTSR